MVPVFCPYKIDFRGKLGLATSAQTAFGRRIDLHAFGDVNVNSFVLILVQLGCFPMPPGAALRTTPVKLM
jgi:hypothetical protein